MNEALQGAEAGKMYSSEGLLQSVRAMHSHTDANRRMQTHASTCESFACCFRRAKTSSRVPTAPAGAHCQSIIFAMRFPDVLSAKSASEQNKEKLVRVSLGLHTPQLPSRISAAPGQSSMSETVLKSLHGGTSFP